MTKKENFKAVFKKYFRKEEAWYIPNILCYFRILLVVIFMIFYLTPFTVLGNDHAGLYFATATMVIASYTDFIDGFIARTFNQTSNLGKVIDPIADKLLQLAASIALCITLREYPAVFLMFAVFLGKEGTLILQDIFLARRNKSFDHAKWYGKISSFFFYLVLGSLLVSTPFIFDAFPDPFYRHVIIDALCAFATFFLALAWVLYTIFLGKILLKNDDELEESAHD